MTADRVGSADTGARTMLFAFHDDDNGGFETYVRLEDFFEAAREYMEPEKFSRFELSVRRAADEMRKPGSPPKRRWWKR